MSFSAAVVASANSYSKIVLITMSSGMARESAWTRFLEIELLEPFLDS